MFRIVNDKDDHKRNFVTSQLSLDKTKDACCAARHGLFMFTAEPRKLHVRL